MVEVEFYDNGRVVKGILLGKYRRPHCESYSYEKKFLWKTKTIYAYRTIDTPLYVVFIPWKHQLKELREVDEKYIVNLKPFDTDETWVTEDAVISETYVGGFYPSSFKVKDFVGYKFMCDNNGFIANLCLLELEDCLKVIYKNIPEILNIDLRNIEE